MSNAGGKIRIHRRGAEKSAPSFVFMTHLRPGALITGGCLVVLASGTLVFFALRDADRRPTLPTPPGVTVPAGLRYVGGDEFNSPGESAPDATRWKTSANLVGDKREAWVSGGLLSLSPNQSCGNNAADVTYREPFAGHRRIRIEMRLRMPCVPALLRRMNADKTPNRGFLPGGVALSPQNTSAHYCIPLVSIEYMNSATPEDGKKRLKEYAAAAPMANAATDGHYDGNFHDYAFEWQGESMHVFRDGVEIPNAMSGRNLRLPVLSEAWRRRLGFLPQPVLDQLDDWRRPALTQPHRIEITCADVPPIPQDDRLRLEVDYVRIFQAD